MLKQRVTIEERMALALADARACAVMHDVDFLDGWTTVRDVACTQDISISRARVVLERAHREGLMDKYHVKNGTPFGVTQYMPTRHGINWYEYMYADRIEGVGDA